MVFWILFTDGRVQNTLDANGALAQVHSHLRSFVIGAVFGTPSVFTEMGFCEAFDHGDEEGGGVEISY